MLLLQKIAILAAIFVACFDFVFSKIVDVTDDNFSKVSKKKSFILLFATEKDCKECKRLFPRFTAVSQSFEGKDDILFGKVRDTTLLEAFNVTKFPTVVYFEQGTAEPKHYKGDISVDGIFDKMKKEMKKDISLVKRQYTVQCTYENFQDVIETPNQFKFLLIYDDESETEIALMEDLAKSFSNDDDIIFPRISVKERSVVRNFGAERFPVLYWYPNVHKAVKKMYGGTFDFNILLVFINEQTFLGRQKNGDLQPTSGQIKELNTFVEDNTFNFQEAASVNMKLVLKNAQAIAVDVPIYRQKYAGYYIHVIDTIAQSGNIDETLENERNDIDDELEKKLRPKRRDSILRKRNILEKFLSEHSKLLAQAMSGEGPFKPPPEPKKEDKKDEKKTKPDKDPKKATKTPPKKKDKGSKKKPADHQEL